MPDHIARAVLRDIDRRGWSISDLAARAEVSRTSLGRWLGGERTGIRLTSVLRVMHALGIKVVEGQHEGSNRPQPPRAGVAHR